MKAGIIRFYTIFFLLSALPPGLNAESLKDFKDIVNNKGQLIQDRTLQTQPVRVAFATPLKQVSDYWRRSIDSFKGRMDEIGLKHEISEFSTRVDENRKLRECVQSALEIDPEYLVLTPNDPEDNMIISRLLNRQNIKIIIQNMTIPNKNWEENPPLMYVGFDHTAGAALIAEEYIRVFHEKIQVKYAMLYHIHGNQVSQFRGDFFNQIIEEKTNFKLVSEYYTGGNKNKAYQATLNILKSQPDIDFIHACSTDIAFGILEAIKEKKMQNKVIVNGWGGGSNELNSLLNGDLNFTVMRMNDDNGVAMAEAIRLDMNSTSMQKPIIYSGDMIIVRKEMSKEQIMGFKKRAFRYSGL